MNKINLEPETKCDFYIDTNRKKIWQVELDMLEKVKDICDKYDINYSLNGGSLLGAIRHKGFIPWDDDIDIMMLRKDYEKFLKIAEKELDNPYFFQYYKTEKGYFYGHAQIRNVNTTAIVKGDLYNNFNHGIFIDIFPLDNVPDDLNERKKFLKRINRSKKILSLYTVRDSKNILKKYLKKIIFGIYWKIKNIDKELERFESECQKYNNIETRECAPISFIQIEKSYNTDWFKEYIETDFENLKMKIIKNYDLFLKNMYGNYMEIPKNKNGSIHGEVFFDTEKGYIEYEKNKGEIIRKLISDN